MGRYSTVQSYSDNNPNMRAVSHSEATTNATGATLKTERVYNPYGSTAGAGSGEFHIYRHARAREKERLKALDEQEKEEIEQQIFDEKIQKWKQEEDDKLDKKRKKRMRNKASKLRKKNISLSGVISSNGNEEGGDVGDDEFEYTPLHVKATECEGSTSKDNDKKSSSNIKEHNDTKSTSGGKGDPASSNDHSSGDDKNHNDQQDCSNESSPQPLLPFKNDGSFLEMMRKMQNSNS